MTDDKYSKKNRRRRRNKAARENHTAALMPQAESIEIEISHRLGGGQGDEGLSINLTATPDFRAVVKAVKPSAFRTMTRNTLFAPLGIVADLWTLPARALLSGAVNVSLKKEEKTRHAIVDVESDEITVTDTPSNS
jgi:hypothetical protein